MPYTADDVIRAVASGPWDPAFNQSHQNAVGALIPLWVSHGWGVADFARLGEYNGHISRTWNARALVGCDLAAELATAHRVLDWRDVQVAAAMATHKP